MAFAGTFGQPRKCAAASKAVVELSRAVARLEIKGRTQTHRSYCFPLSSGCVFMLGKLGMKLDTISGRSVFVLAETARKLR
jgi:hypothetical protein